MTDTEFYMLRGEMVRHHPDAATLPSTFTVGDRVDYVGPHGEHSGTVTEVRHVLNRADEHSVGYMIDLCCVGPLYVDDESALTAAA